MNSPHHLVAGSEVQGRPVYSASGEKVGKIADLLIDKASGRAVYALMSFDGFLGVGTRYYPLPWAKLDYDPDKRGFSSRLSREEIENGPAVVEKEVGDEIAWRERVHDYYQVAPYWP